MTPPAFPNDNSPSRQYGVWLRVLRQWHWISSAICLIGILLFTITGITLNHAGRIEAKPEVFYHSFTLPAELLDQLPPSQTGHAALPDKVARWVGDRLSVTVGSRPAEWSEHDIYLSMPGPGADAWLSIERETGIGEYEHTRRGWIAYFNDLHKGRNTGPAWQWFLDVFALACLVFCITGLLLLYLHARQRPMTWPLVGLGLIVPLMIALIFIH